MRAFFNFLFQAAAFSSILFSTQISAESLDGVSTPIKTETGQTVVLDPTDGFIAGGQTHLRAEWSWVSRPSLSVAGFSDPALLRPSVTIDVPGTYLAELALFDAADSLSTIPLATTQLEISTDNLTPVARILARGLSEAHTPFFVDGTQSYDRDGDGLTYQWSVVSAPAGSSTAITDATSPLSSVSYDETGSYQISLEVTDDTGRVSIPAVFAFEVTGTGTDAGDALSMQATLGTFNLVSEQFFGRQEVEGRTFIGSSVENTNGQFGFDPQQDGEAFAELYIAGDLRNSNINLTPGDVAKISGTRFQSNVNNGTLVENATDLPLFDFAYFKAQSAFLASLTGTAPDLQDQNHKRFGGIPNAVSGEAVFGPNTRIVTATMQDLQTGGYSIDVSQSDTVIINVSGTSGTFQMNPLGGTPSAEKVLWNFYEATSINVNSVIMGHVLAPHAQMTGFSGSSEGSVIAKDVRLTNGELHQRQWNGQIPISGEVGSISRSSGPVASARFDQLVAVVGQTQTLEPYASTDLDGGSLSATASLLVQPPSSNPSLLVAADASATFTADVAGDYLIAYEVTDGQNKSVDHILISAEGNNTRPVAQINPFANPVTGVATSLDGTQSHDFDGDLLFYNWSLLSAPNGSNAGLAEANTPLASFTADVAGLYVIQLQVDDGQASSVPALVPLVVGAPLPIANAGLDVLPDDNGVALLDGSLSVGIAPDFEWTRLGLASGDVTDFDDSTLAAPTFMLGAQDGLLRDIVAQNPVYEIRRGDLGGLCKFDTRAPADIANPGQSWWHGVLFWGTGKVTTSSGDVPVWLIDNRRDFTREVVLEGTDGTDFGTWTIPGRTVLYFTTPAPAPGVQLRAFLDGNQIAQSSPTTWTFNRTDTVCAGASSAVVQLVVSDINGISLPDTILVGEANLRPVLFQTATVQTNSGETVNLSAADLGFDANSDPLTYNWSLAYRPFGSAATVSADPLVTKIEGVTLDFTPDRPGLYLVQLEATDGVYQAEPVVLSIVATNASPVAVATITSPVFVADIATLDGSGSFDPDADALNFNWRIVSAPNGSTAVLSSNTAVSPTFEPDIKGSYTFELVVSDLGSSSDPVNVTLTIPNRSPNAELQGPAAVNAGDIASFSAAASSDADGDTLTFVYEVILQPSGATPLLNDQGNGILDFSSETGGDYILQVTVSDGESDATATLEIAVLAGNNAPVLGALNPVYTVELGLELALDLTATDADGDVLSFFATPLPLPSGVTVDGQTGKIRFRPEAGQEGSYSLTVGVSDGIATDIATLNVDVVPGTAGDTVVAGRVLDAVDFANGVETPLANMPVRLADAALMTLTAADGTFSFGSLNEGGDFVFVEPSSNGGPGGYASARRRIQITGNQIRDLSPDFLLAPINDGCVEVVAGAETILSGVASGVTLRIAADTIQDSTGAAYSGDVCLGSLPQLFAQPGFPEETQACQIYALDAPGAVFTQGVQITGPNLDLLPEQTSLGLWRLPDNTTQFRRLSTAQVDAGGASVTGTASAFTSGSLFTFLPQSPRVVASADMPNGNRSLTPFEGDLSETYVLPGYRAFNRTQQVSLSYHSTAADPAVIVAGDVTIAADASVPETVQTRLLIGGLDIRDDKSWTPRLAVDGSAPALIGEAVTLRQSMPLDATALSNGRYDYTYFSSAKYACSTVAGTYQGELYVQNETDSPYGQGWSVDELQSLVENPDGSVAIIDDDDIATFNPETSFTEFDDSPLVFPARGVQGLAIADYNDDGTPDIAYADSGTARIGIIYNFGNRQFEQGPLIELPGVVTNAVPDDLSVEYSPNLRDIGTLDVNLDGLPDIVYGTQFGNRVDYLINDGGTGFVYEAGNEIDARFFRELSVADMDGDGYEDVLIGGVSTFSVNQNDKIYVDYVTPNGRELVNFLDGRPGRLGMLQVMAGDIDNDGETDIAYRGSNRFGFMYNEGSRQYSFFDPELGCISDNPLGSYALLGDYNEDGRLDYVNSRNYVSRFSCQNDKSPLRTLDVYLNDGGRDFLDPIELSLPVAEPGFIFSLDTDGDGHLDLVRSAQNSIVVYKGNGDGTFLPPETGLLGYPLDFAEPFDIDGDGAPDLISAQRFSVTINFTNAASDGALIAGAGEFSTLEKQPDGSWVRRYKDGNIVEFDVLGQQVAEIDTQGNRREMTYDPEGRLLTIIDQVAGITAFTYDGEGRLEKITYPDGRETVFEFENQQLVTITEPDTDTVAFAYDENGRLVSTTNQNGNTSTYSYDDTGRMAGANLPDGSTIKNQVAGSLGVVDLLGNATASPRPYVAPEDRFTTVTDRKGQITEVVVNRFGSTLQITDPLGRITTMTRDDDDLVTRVERPSDALGGAQRIDTLAYDALANVTSMTEAVGSSTERTMTYEYEPVFSKVTQMTDGDGFVTQYEYDQFGEVTKITDPEGGEQLFTYTAEGKTQTRSDENGNTTSFSYAANQNLDQIMYADGSVTDMTYDARGNTTIITEAAGAPEERQVQRTYDSDNRVLSVEVTAADGTQIDGITSYAYDGVGNLTSVVDETNLVTLMSYDPLERLTEVNDPAEGLIRRVYNEAGEVIQHINGANEAHDYVYDDVSRLTQTTDPEGYVKTFAYDVRDNISTVTDGRGGVTTFAYDPLDRMTTRTNPINQTMLRAYDLRDNLTVLTREDGAIETAAYDDLSRRTQVVTPDNTLTYAYDPRSNLTEAADNDSRVTFTYDERNRLASTTTDGSFGLQPEVTLSYTYDALDRRLSMSDSLGGVTRYAYDPEDRLTKLTAPWGTEYDFGYDGFGRRTSLTSTSGRVSTMGYTNGLLSALKHAQNGVALTDLAYRYDVDGQLIGIDDLLDPSKSKGIAYDELNRLVQVAEGVPVASGGTQLPLEDYAYDEEGNRTVSHLSVLYASNDHNQLAEDDEFTYAYDEKGNRISKTAKVGGAVETYSYDSQNRLVGYASETTTASYAYDALERRIAKTVDVVGTAYVYDMSTADPLAMDDITLEFKIGSIPTLKRRWAHSSAVDEPVGFEEYTAYGPAGSGSERLMYADRQGSILWVTDPGSDAVVAAYEYEGFGERSQTHGTLVQPYGFNGREFDTENGLYYLRARLYDPVGGLFVQSDPIGFQSGALNITEYVNNNPTNLKDATGLTATRASLNTTAQKGSMDNLAFTATSLGALSLTGKITQLLAVGPVSLEVFRKTGEIRIQAPGFCSQKTYEKLSAVADAIQTAGKCKGVPPHLLKPGAQEALGVFNMTNLRKQHLWSRKAIARATLGAACFGQRPDNGHKMQVQQHMANVRDCAKKIRVGTGG